MRSPEEYAGLAEWELQRSEEVPDDEAGTQARIHASRGAAYATLAAVAIELRNGR